MSKDNNTSTMAEAIQLFLKKYKLEAGGTKADLWLSWETIMGPSIAKHTQGIELRNDVLIIRLGSSALRHELGFAKDKIMEKINAHIGSQVVKEVMLV
jgi:predicted nucleic acid-binding Zn ribbon protein